MSSVCHVADLFVERVVDSTADYHVTPRQELFTSCKEGNFRKVMMGNEDFASVVRIDDICLQTNVGCSLMLINIRHVPYMHLNLLSINAFDEAGSDNYFW